MHKKNYKNATNEISNNEKKAIFGIFRLGKPQVANLTPGIDCLRNFTPIINIFLKIFFYRPNPLVAKVAKKSFCSSKMATESKTGVETSKKFFLS